MIKEIIIFSVLIFGSTSISGKNEIEAIHHVLHTVLSASIKHYFTNWVEESLQKINVSKDHESLKYVEIGDATLNSTLLVEVLENLKTFFQEPVPMVPFAIAEPTSDNILVFFGILNSSFVNLTQYDVEASVNNTSNRTDIDVILHLNSSGLIGHYELDVSNYDMHFYGDGEYSMITNGTNIFITTTFVILPNNSYLMSKFSLNMSIDSAQLVMTNFMEGDPSMQPILYIFAQAVPAEVPVVMDLIQDTVNLVVTNFFNTVVVSLAPTWDDFIAMLQQLAEV